MMLPRSFAIAFLALPLLAGSGPVRAEAITGSASVIDGDRIAIRGEAIHLAGVDAPERGQTCADEHERRYPCGRNAEMALAEKVVGRSVTCEPVPADRSFPTVAVCRVGNEDLGAWLVSEGLAVADRLTATAYVAQEDAAKQAKRGIWAGSFTMPWDLRRGVRAKPDGYYVAIGTPLVVRPPPEDARKPGCAIKGNITGEGSKLYWVPGSRRYNETVITESSGERWFCNVEEAKAAGWQEPLQPFGPQSPAPVVVANPTAAPVAVATPAAAPVAEQKPDCRIKGNITRDGSKLYWVPGSRRYNETVITESSGERWFCTEDEARAAGWQEPQAPFGPRGAPPAPAAAAAPAQ